MLLVDLNFERVAVAAGRFAAVEIDLNENHSILAVACLLAYTAAAGLVVVTVNVEMALGFLFFKIL
jgi:hypothetical protein